MTSQKTTDEIRKIVEDLGSEISDGSDALFAIGRLDALASAITRAYSLTKQVTKAASLSEVLREAAKRQKSKEHARVLRAAARKASELLKISEEISYGELHEGGVRRAEGIRSRLYDLLYDEWLESLSIEDEEAEE